MHIKNNSLIELVSLKRPLLSRRTLFSILDNINIQKVGKKVKIYIFFINKEITRNIFFFLVEKLEETKMFFFIEIFQRKVIFQPELCLETAEIWLIHNKSVENLWFWLTDMPPVEIFKIVNLDSHRLISKILKVPFRLVDWYFSYTK